MSNTISYYIQKVTSQYKNSPKFIVWLTAALDKLQDISNIADAMEDYFKVGLDLGTAILTKSGEPILTKEGDEIFTKHSILASGVQLDIIGDIVGIKRELPFEPTYGSPIESSLMDDITYTVAILAKIAKNNWDGKIQSINDIFKLMFPTGTLIIQDNQDMTCDITLIGATSNILIDLIQHDLMLPRPEGVYYDYGLPTHPLFGFDMDDDFVTGFDAGFWS